MSALRELLPCVCLVVLMLSGLASNVAEGSKSDAGPGVMFVNIEYPAMSGPAPNQVSRGDLILVDDENLTLTGDLTFRKGYLASGSILRLVDCNIDFIGDGNEEPSLEGNPDRFVMFNSTLTMTGWNGTSRLLNNGANASISLSISEEMRIVNSRILMKGGEGWSPEQPGARFEVDLKGFEFSGGNCSFDIDAGPDSRIDLLSSNIEMVGGKGGDAPDGESMIRDDFFQSGGYTTGANVSGWVGSGGGKEFRIRGETSSISFVDTEIFLLEGYGGDAGDAGNVIWAGEDTYSKPTSSGGYTSGGWSGGESYQPGTVSENVGRGGFAEIDLICMDLEIENTRFDLLAGSGGKSGRGGSCISPEQGSPLSVTNTLGGGGGGGYAGGYGGYRSLTSYDGGDGGDVLDRVASGGDSFITINCSNSLWTNSFDITNYGGLVSSMAKGGSGGGSVKYGLDGGGGGGGGMSGGGGAPADMLLNTFTGGMNGTENGLAAWGGGAFLSINSKYYMSQDKTDVISFAGQCFSTSGLSGMNGEVGGSDVYAGGPGGRGQDFGARIGPSSTEIKLPAPFPVQPVNDEIITDLSDPFQWSELDTGLYSGSGNSIKFRVLNSEDVTDVVQERDCTGTSTTLLHDLVDGTYYWTVKVITASRESTWMYPQKFTIDREYPAVISGADRNWYTIDNCSPRIRFRENTSGLDPGSIECRAGPSGGPYSNWYDIGMEYLGNGIYDVVADLEPAEMNYTFWVRASDLAGNGPVLAGPFIVGIDETPPVVEIIAPSTWTGPVFNIEFTCQETLSGLADDFWMFIDDGLGGENISMNIEGSGVGNFRTSEPIELSEGNYTIEIFARDIAGNIGSGGVVDLFVDGTIPELAGFYPSDGAVVSDPFPTPSVKIVDPLSGPRSLDYHLEGPSGTFDLRYGDFDTSVDVTIGQPLLEGIYTWSISSKDLAGNELNAGPFTFIVDLSGPEVQVQSISREEGSIHLSYDDSLTEASSVEVECSIPSATGISAVWTRSMDVHLDGHSGTINLDLLDEIPDPVAYFRIRGTDISGNQGEWSSIFRSDPANTVSIIEIEASTALASGTPLAVRIRSDIGISPGTVELVIEDETGAISILGPRDSAVLLNATPIEGSDLKVPSLVNAIFEIPYDDGILDIRVEARDPFHMPMKWGSNVLTVVIDNSPPVIEIDANRFYTSREVEIPFIASDEDSPITSFEISRDGGPFRVLNSPGTSSLLVKTDDDHILGINLSWGELSEFSVRVTDLAGHSSIVSFSTRATRPPQVRISQSIPTPIIFGSTIAFTAQGSDKDGDDLEYRWFIDGELHGSGIRIEPILDPGVHTIRVNCSDGDLFSESQIQILVEEEEIFTDEKGSSPLIVIVLSILILLIIGGIVAGFLIWKKRGEDEESSLNWDDDEADDENHIIKSGTSRKGEDGTQCSICLRPLRSSSNILKCRCGARFHRGCAVKEGECPDCGRELMLRKDL